VKRNERKGKRFLKIFHEMFGEVVMVVMDIGEVL
jgi:hypothetical protein